MKTFGPLYGGQLNYWHRKFLPVVEIGTTQEVEYPYRKGKCLVLRVPFTEPGYYFGIFYQTPKISPDDDIAIDDLLRGALKGRTAWTPEDGEYDEVFTAPEKNRELE